MNRYDGLEKVRTKNCDSCPYLRIVKNEERCYWGVAWKPLFPTERPAKCMLRDKQSPRRGKKHHLTQDAFGQYIIYCNTCDDIMLYCTKKRPSEEVINDAVKNHYGKHHAQRKLSIMLH